MPDPSTEIRIADQDALLTDRHLTAPTLDVRWLAGVVVMMPLLLAAGVYWLHHVPAGTGRRVTDTVVSVRLITPEEQIEPRQEAALQASPQVAALQTNPLVDTLDRSRPEETMTLAPPMVSQPSPPATMSAPAPSAAAVRVPTTQMTATFQRTLLAHIARFRHYPAAARPDRLQGTVQVMFAMLRDGSVTDVWIRSSSGSNILDAAAVDTICKAQPLPKIPSEMPSQLNVIVPVAFDLTLQ